MNLKITPMILRAGALAAIAGTLSGCLQKKDPWNDFMDSQPAPTALPGSEETKPVDMAAVPFDQKMEKARTAQAVKNVDRARQYFDAAVAEGKTFGPADPRYHSALEAAAFFNYQNQNPKLGLDLFEELRIALTSTFGADSLQVAAVLQHLGNVYKFLGNYVKSEESFKASISIRERGAPSPELGYTIRDYADMLRVTKRQDEAERMDERFKDILAKTAKK